MRKMKYQEKVKFAEIAITMLEKGDSRDDIENYLKGEGLKSWDIEKVNKSIDKHLKIEYKSRIKKYMLDNSLESKLSEFDDVDADLFESIQYEIIREIKLESIEKVKSLVLEGKGEKEILETEEKEFFNKEEIYNAIAQVGYQKIEKTNQANKGISFIILGVILTIVSIDIIPGVVMVFYGLIIYGIGLLIKSKWDI